MSVSKKEYDKMTKDASPSSPIVLNCIKAFVFGGAICLLGEVLFSLYRMTDMREDEVKALVPMTLIVITSILTAIGVFDKIARHAGAGTIVPITGFANSIVSPAMEYNREGVFFGVCAKMFVIAGPIIVFGVVASFLVGLVGYFVGL